MDYNRLAELLFPNVTGTPDDMETKYPLRNLPEGAKVTRFAPSPTGFVHLGGLYGSTIDERLAHQSDGVVYLRIEDTDAKREVAGATEKLIRTLAHYGVEFDEGAILDENGNVADRGDYGPYKQSLRGPIYHIYAKDLVQRGLAYPCFTTEEEYEELQAIDKKAEVKSKEWNDAANKETQQRKLAMRDFTIEDVTRNLQAGNPWVLRILSDGDGEKKVIFEDLIKGKMEMPVNDEDFVLLKSDGIPTYHFAHAVDDHLMRTTHVIRGEEWLPSAPKHLQLFRYLGFKPPKYMHTATVMKLDEAGNKKKLSKRDKGGNVDDYTEMGYAPACVCDYLMTILNSNFEEWRMQNPEKSYREFPFSIKKMSGSGCLVDLPKLSDIAKNVVSRMTADEVYTALLEWTQIYDPEFYALLAADADYAKSILAIGRGGKNPRKDFGVWSEVKDYMGFFYDTYFAAIDTIPDTFDKTDIQTVIERFKAGYDESDDMNAWFDKVKAIAADLGFAADMKAYKADPSAFKGNVADVSMFLRVAVTGKMNAPDLYTVMHILGKERTFARLDTLLTTLA